ncbi:hypothetical protein [Nitratiruptor tergarcus]|uniref:Uncharacterized protein n=1 Tax=Nitratiruptor tergarcus DSM 16512 TaxID=1069081 RepID=A0A1W1WQI7_9BACT|nr:hypothetical protein [Nitratiruptor tergarcus]SMC08547.1 hypothetical protein SAMN05660197_0302 [Nitratiruptor tergarcus DSM 16512]
MKRLSIFFFFTFSLFANTQDIEREIYKTIIHSLFPHKHIVLVWSDSDKELFTAIQNVLYTTKPEKADIIFLKKPLPLHSPNLRKKILFVRNYPLLKKYRNWAIGGFFWQKGRPNILFFKNNLTRYRLTLPPSFQKYIDEGIE